MLTVKGALHPKLTERVNEGFPLGTVVAISSWNAEQECIVLCHRVRSGERNGGVLRRSVHLGCDFLWEGFLDSERASSVGLLQRSTTANRDKV